MGGGNGCEDSYHRCGGCLDVADDVMMMMMMMLVCL
jgi:hypothetical protein